MHFSVIILLLLYFTKFPHTVHNWCKSVAKKIITIIKPGNTLIIKDVVQECNNAYNNTFN